MTKYKHEVLSVYEGDKPLGFIVRRHIIFGLHQDVSPGWCIMLPMVNLWEGNYKTRKEAGEALQAYGKKRHYIS